MVLSGVTVRTDQVELLARMLEGDALAEKLTRGVQNGNDLVALSVADRDRIIAVLDEPPPSGLAELRSTLVRQMKEFRGREDRAEKAREAARMREARDPGKPKP